MSEQVIYFLGDPHLTNRAPRSRVDDYGETCRRKFAYVCEQAAEENAILILAGDVFHTPVQVTSFVNSVIKVVKKSRVRAYTLAGNHDVVNYNFSKVLDTSIGSLIVSGTVPLLKRLKIGKWQIVSHNYMEELTAIETTKDHPYLFVVSHSFYETSHADKMNVEKWEVEESPASILCLGHDHTQYPVLEVNGTYVVRPGSMTRATSHTCNYSRTPSYARIVIDTQTGEFEITYEAIPHLAATEVFLLKDDSDAGVSSFDDVRALIDEIKMSGGALNPFQVLDGMNLPVEVHDLCVDYMHGVGIFRNAQEAVEAAEVDQ